MKKKTNRIIKKNESKKVVSKFGKTVQGFASHSFSSVRTVQKSLPKKLTAVSPLGRSKIAPLGSRVLIKPFTKEELQPKNSFGIILPDSGKEKSEQGIVIALGPGESQDGKLVSPKVNVGDKVVFSKYGYEDVNIDGEELFLIKEENILAVIK